MILMLLILLILFLVYVVDDDLDVVAAVEIIEDRVYH